MLATRLVRSRLLRCSLPAAPLPPPRPGPPGRARTQPPPAPSLEGDADPILSPDVEVKAPEPPAVQIGKPPGAGDKGIQKQAQGFVLRADVDEGLLNSSG